MNVLAKGRGWVGSPTPPPQIDNKIIIVLTCQFLYYPSYICAKRQVLNSSRIVEITVLLIIKIHLVG